MYIGIEGPNFSGKTTLSKIIEQHYIDLGRRVSIVTGISKLHPLGELIHNDGRLYKNPAIVNDLMIAAEKYFYYYNVILPKLNSQEIVISDRYLVTCVAYNYLYGLDPELTWRIYESLPKANLIIYLRVDEDILMERMKERRNLSFTELKFSRKQELAAFEMAVDFMQKKGVHVFIVEQTTDQAALENLMSFLHSAIE
ncbi:MULTISPECIES: hypothetical protein [Pseudomonas]|uniref:dTMP kinase n=1 Tax=Pseudomonas TaxID=286 RepID=UPI0014737100|nr:MULTISPECIES: hypothetical protein [Pseudomonas]MCU0211242.1 hypothetical protein [Pseudomonas shahriarae]NMY21355.1 hypothetical protein [Pseudomonas sp. WS 5410]